jgi:hypothetical protein
MSVADAQLVALRPAARGDVLERQRVVERLRRTDLGRGQPALEDLADGPALARPGARLAPLAAVLVDADPHAARRGAGDHAPLGRRQRLLAGEEEALLLSGVVQRARMQIGLFTVILTLTAAVIVMMVMYNLTLEKTHDSRCSSSWARPGAPPRAGAAAGLAARGAGLRGGLWHRRAAVFPLFPRRVLITRPSRWSRRSPRWASSRSRASSASPRHAHRSVARAGGMTMEDAVRAVDLSKTYGTGRRR